MCDKGMPADEAESLPVPWRLEWIGWIKTEIGRAIYLSSLKTFECHGKYMKNG